MLRNKNKIDSHIRGGGAWKKYLFFINMFKREGFRIYSFYANFTLKILLELNNLIK